MRAKENWAASQQQYQACIDSMMLEKEESVRQHTIETGELRQRNAYLMQQLQRYEGAAMSAAPGVAAGFPTDFTDFGGLPPPSWDDFAAPPGPRFTLEAEPPRPDPASGMLVPKREPATPAAGSMTSPPTNSEGDDKGMASGILLVLLLCGAWVASRGGNAASTTSASLAIPEDVRAASGAILDDLYRNSGVRLDENMGLPPRSIDHGPEGAPSSFVPGTNVGMEMLHRQLTSPSQQQLREQAFTLTPAQYNHIAGDGEDTLMSPPPTAALDRPSQGRNLGDAVAAAAASAIATGKDGAAETYTRSLMRDRVSTQVLQDFARMVRGGG